MTNEQEIAALNAVGTFIDTEVAQIATLTTNLATALATQDVVPANVGTALQALQDKITAIQTAKLSVSVVGPAVST